MKCVKCGFENEKDARYCENCGEKLTKTSVWQYIKILAIGLCLLLLVVTGLLYIIDTAKTKGESNAMEYHNRYDEQNKKYIASLKDSISIYQTKILCLQDSIKHLTIKIEKENSDIKIWKERATKQRKQMDDNNRNLRIKNRAYERVIMKHGLHKEYDRSLGNGKDKVY